MPGRKRHGCITGYSTLERAQYLEMEDESSTRHEYVDGYVYALAGGTQAHGVIVINVATLLRVAARGGSCRVFSSDVKIRVTTERYLYPDVSVGCDPSDLRDEARWLEAPRLIVEVLSDSTAEYDRGDKFTLYQAIAALRDYVLVEMERQVVEVRSRHDDGVWTSRTFGPGESVILPSLTIELPIAAIYEDTGVPAQPTASTQP